MLAKVGSVASERRRLLLTLVALPDQTKAKDKERGGQVITLLLLVRSTEGRKQFVNKRMLKLLFLFSASHGLNTSLVFFLCLSSRLDQPTSIPLSK